MLREKRNVLILLGGLALREGAQRWANRIAAATGARLMAEGSNARIQRGRGRLPLERVPYPAPQAIEALKWVEHLIAGERPGAHRLLRLSRTRPPSTTRRTPPSTC